MRRRSLTRRNITFVTGTRAEYGLMLPVLRAIQSHPRLNLQIFPTGMHLDHEHGNTLGSIQSDNWPHIHPIPWPPAPQRDRNSNAINTGNAIASLARAFSAFKSDIVLVVGDRVEAFAAASAAHISGIPLAHVHGGDRAAGQIDDALRHAITKLAHIHFPATRQSAARIVKLGEDRWRIHRAGSPGIDQIRRSAASRIGAFKAVGDCTPGKFALLVLHPAAPDDALEFQRAVAILSATQSIPFSQIHVIYPNNDPGSPGILRAWDAASANPDPRVHFHRDLPRNLFLALLRDCAVLIGNSSSGIIEAASFGTPVLDIGPRQSGREHGPNVIHLPYTKSRGTSALARLWNKGHPKRHKPHNIYGGTNTARSIANTLASVGLDDRLLAKLIRY